MLKNQKHYEYATKKMLILLQKEQKSNLEVYLSEFNLIELLNEYYYGENSKISMLLEDFDKEDACKSQTKIYIGINKVLIIENVILTAYVNSLLHKDDRIYDGIENVLFPKLLKEYKMVIRMLNKLKNKNDIQTIEDNLAKPILYIREMKRIEIYNRNKENQIPISPIIEKRMKTAEEKLENLSKITKHIFLNLNMFLKSSNYSTINFCDYVESATENLSELEDVVKQNQVSRLFNLMISIEEILHYHNTDNEEYEWLSVQQLVTNLHKEYVGEMVHYSL